MKNGTEWDMLKKAGEKIAAVLREDPGGRGLLSAELPDQTAELISALEHAGRVLLLTGFPVRREDGRIAGETDGPLGTADIAWALEQCGAEVIAMTDGNCFPQLAAAFKARGCRSRVLEVPGEGTEGFFEALFDESAPTLLITLERPGKARDGHFHNMRGGIIDPMLTDTDPALKTARLRGVPVISVGDGGNELGTGALRREVEAFVPHGALICADQAADVTLISGVSNWWGFGVAGLLSLMHGRDLLPDSGTETAVLRAVLASGGADGASGLAEETVDRLPMDVHLAVLESVRKIVGEAEI